MASKDERKPMDASTQHRLPAVIKSQLAEHLDVWDAANQAWFDCADKLAHLSMRACRQLLDESQAMSCELAGSAGPAEFWSAASQHTQPGLECLAEYGRHVAEVTVELRDGLGKAVQDAIACASRYSGEFLEAGASGLPQGSEFLDRWLKSALTSGAQRPDGAGTSRSGRTRAVKPPAPG
ncbi:MAG TPA: phasin family protein [Pseudoduganella sp.]